MPHFLTSIYPPCSRKILLWYPCDQLDQDADLPENCNPTKIPLDFSCVVSLIQLKRLNVYN